MKPDHAAALEFAGLIIEGSGNTDMQNIAAAYLDLAAKLEAWQELSDHVTISPTGIYPGRYTDPAVQRVAQWIKDTEAKLEAVNDNCTSWQRNAEVWQLKCEAERKAREEADRRTHTFATGTTELAQRIMQLIGGHPAYPLEPQIVALKERAEQAESSLAAMFERTRERCAKVCEEYEGTHQFEECANAIRALQEEK